MANLIPPRCISDDERAKKPHLDNKVGFFINQSEALVITKLSNIYFYFKS